MKLLPISACLFDLAQVMSSSGIVQQGEMCPVSWGLLLP